VQHNLGEQPEHGVDLFPCRGPAKAEADRAFGTLQACAHCSEYCGWRDFVGVTGGAG
jgi:hypothetical protein